MHDDLVGQHCCTFAVDAGLPLPLRVKLLAPLISETILSHTTCHRVLQVHNKKICIIWNKLYSIHTHEHFQFCKSCQDVLGSSVLCLTTYECVSRTYHSRVYHPRIAPADSELWTNLHTLHPKCKPYKLLKHLSFTVTASFVIQDVGCQTAKSASPVALLCFPVSRNSS